MNEQFGRLSPRPACWECTLCSCTWPSAWKGPVLALMLITLLITVFKSLTSLNKTPHFHFALDPQNHGVQSWLSFSAKTADVCFLREEGDMDYGRGWMACAQCVLTKYC